MVAKRMWESHNHHYLSVHWSLVKGRCKDCFVPMKNIQFWTSVCFDPVGWVCCYPMWSVLLSDVECAVIQFGVLLSNVEHAIIWWGVCCYPMCLLLSDVERAVIQRGVCFHPLWSMLLSNVECAVVQCGAHCCPMWSVLLCSAVLEQKSVAKETCAQSPVHSGVLIAGVHVSLPEARNPSNGVWLGVWGEERAKRLYILGPAEGRPARQDCG